MGRVEVHSARVGRATVNVNISANECPQSVASLPNLKGTSSTTPREPSPPGPQRGGAGVLGAAFVPRFVLAPDLLGVDSRDDDLVVTGWRSSGQTKLAFRASQ